MVLLVDRSRRRPRGFFRLGVLPNQERALIWSYVFHDGAWYGTEETRLRYDDFGLECYQWASRSCAVTRRLEGDLMFVTVIHHIHDPEGFQAAEAKALEAGLPSHVALPIHAATNDHGLGICIWEGESVDAVREVVEGAVGPWANNEYYEMHVDGLTPQLGT